VQAKTDAPLKIAPDCKEMNIPAKFHVAQPTA
jgi:hypothetical protein